MNARDHPTARRVRSACWFGLLLALPATVQAWPLDSQWRPVLRNGIPIQDDNGDTNGSRNIVSGPGKPAFFTYNDGLDLHFRMRLDQNPTGAGGQGLLQPFGWGVEFDTNRNVSNYEWLIIVDGIAQTETISLWQNTVQGSAGDPGDRAEVQVFTNPLAGNFRVTAADSAFNGHADFFLDFRFPWATLMQYTGLTDTSPVRLFGGSSSSANALTENGADLIGASDLTTGFSDLMTPFGILLTPLGTLPSDGTVRFVSDLAGAGDITQIAPGEPLFLRVDDPDLNHDVTTRQSLTVTITTSGGDRETITLTETGPDTGIFTGQINSVDGNPVTGSGQIECATGESITATYVDTFSADMTRNVLRTDSVAVRSPVPLLALDKRVDPATALPGETLTYRLQVRNLGDGTANAVLISDMVPAYTTYVAGSLRLGGAATTYDAAAPLTDQPGDDAGEMVERSVLFRLPPLAPNDGVTNAGDDERLLYFRVRVE